VILGAVLAGGRSTRFGSDKALAVLGGETLLARAVGCLRGQCDDVVVVGREGGIPDWPAPDRGPLGGLAAALRHGAALGAEAVLSLPVDAVGAYGLRAALAPAPAFVESQPVIGLWPVAALPVLEAILLGAGKHSLRAFAAACGARGVCLAHAPANINTTADLAALEDVTDGL
jgi:molybdopterin-guanine dinucleotide biosynthesis protein A